MPPPRLRVHRDANETPIINELKRKGFTVSRVCGCGGKQSNGFPDLVVSWEAKSASEPWRTVARGTLLLEIKRNDGPASGQKLSDAQEDFRKRWKGHVFKITTPEAAVEAVESHRKEVLSYGRINVES